eukprot:213225_1
MQTSLFVLIGINIHTHAQWNVITRSTPPLPRGECNQAVGYYDDTIYIFGGGNTSNARALSSLIEYTISTDTMLSVGQSPYDVSAHGQYYTQMNNKLYWLEGNGGYGIFVYDYALQTFAQLDNSPTSVDYSCLTSYNNLLLVIAGLAHTTVQVFNTANSQWIAGVSSINSNRREASCATDTRRGIAYVIAGADFDIGWRSDFETLVIGDDPTTAPWITNPNTLTYATWGVRAMYNDYDDSILVFGNDIISRIDCATGSVSTVAALNYVIRASGAVLAEHAVYLFGGCPSAAVWYNTWQYITNPLVLGTAAPTRAPSSVPTQNPSKSPTKDPSKTPTQNPSKSPTQNPSKAPTQSPFKSPSQNPSPSPSQGPSKPPIQEASVYVSPITTEETDRIDVPNNAFIVGANVTYVMIAASIVLCCLVVLCCVMIVYCVRLDKNKKQIQEMIVSKPANISKDNGISNTNAITDTNPKTGVLLGMPLQPTPVHIETTPRHSDSEASSGSKQNITEDNGNECKDSGYMDKCAECGEINTGVMSDVDGCFYCKKCWKAYGENEEDSDHDSLYEVVGVTTNTKQSHTNTNP